MSSFIGTATHFRSTGVVRSAVIAVAVLASFLGITPAATPSQRRIEITAKRYAFEPAEITVKKGEAVDLVLRSQDVSHGVRIRDLNLNLSANKGGVAEAHFMPQAKGDFVGHCSVFCGSGHGRMTLVIHVVD